VGIRNTFYRIAVIFGNVVLVYLAGQLQLVFRDRAAFTWSLVFYGVAGLFVAIWLYHAYIMPRPKSDAPRQDTTAAEVWQGVKAMFSSLLHKMPPRPLLFALLFMLLYRFPEAMLTKMSTTFLLRPGSAGGLGLSPQEFSLAYGTVGLVGLLLGGIVGGWLASRDGLKRWLWPMVMAITLPDLVYVYMSYALPDSLWLVSTMLFIEQFGYGLGFTALTLYMLFFAQGAYKTSHYAICTGISYLGLMLPGMVSGWLKDAVGYRQFFIIVMAFCLVTFVVTALIHIDPNFGKKQES
jgi:PAT family beta-lactamase induction signal transducer AmpG